MAESSESDQERSLPATPRRLEQAREEGQVPRSRSLGNVAVLGAMALVLWMTGPALFGGFTRFLQRGLSLDHESAINSAAMLQRLSSATFEAAVLTLPGLFFVMLAGVAAPLLLGGWVFSTQSFMPDLGKLNPLAGLARMFSLQSLADMAKVVAEAIVVALVLVWFMWGSRQQLTSLVMGSTDGGVHATGDLVVGALLFIVLALGAAAAVDVPLQLWRFGQRLRMTLEEVKRESRESDGDPQLKARIRSMQREMAKGRMMQQVPKADVVITNPTHYAVALKYDQGGKGAPRVVAKGMALVAERIRDIAGEHQIPIVEAPPLARALHAHAKLEAEVPPALYNAVAQVLAFVYQLRAANAVVPSTPFEMPGVDVPNELDPATKSVPA